MVNKWKRKTGLAFGIRMVWRELSNHLNDSNFYLMHVAAISSRTLSKEDYPNISSAIRLVFYSDDLPVQIFQGFKDLFNEFSTEFSIQKDTDNDDDLLLSQGFKPKIFN